MKLSVKNSLLLLVVIVLLIGCKTYYIPVESFIAYPKGNVGRELDHIVCYDKKGNTKFMKNDGSVEIRITDKNKKRQGGYFETLVINDSLAIFTRSIFLSLDAVFKLEDICLIEIQNVKKGLKHDNEKSLNK